MCVHACVHAYEYVYLCMSMHTYAIQGPEENMGSSSMALSFPLDRDLSLAWSLLALARLATQQTP